MNSGRMGEQELKGRVRDRDGMRCTKCGMTNDEHLARYESSLQVHRLRPGEPYTVEGCVTLCIPCHGPEPRSPRGGTRYTYGGKVIVNAYPTARELDRLRRAAKLQCRSVPSLIRHYAIVAAKKILAEKASG